MQRTVYVVADYDSLYGIYSTLELAGEARRRFGCCDWPIEERVLDEMPPLRDGKYGWFIELKSTGFRQWEFYSAQYVNTDEFVNRELESWLRELGDCSIFCVRCLAKTREEAIGKAMKLAADSV